MSRGSLGIACNFHNFKGDSVLQLRKDFYQKYDSHLILFSDVSFTNQPFYGSWGIVSNSDNFNLQGFMNLIPFCKKIGLEPFLILNGSSVCRLGDISEVQKYTGFFGWKGVNLIFIVRCLFYQVTLLLRSSCVLIRTLTSKKVLI